MAGVSGNPRRGRGLRLAAAAVLLSAAALFDIGVLPALARPSGSVHLSDRAPTVRPLLPSGQRGPLPGSRLPRVRLHRAQSAHASIVGGVGATQGQFRFMAFVVHYDAAGNADFTCSGTVVSSNVVLTAGHCAIDETTGAALDTAGFRVVTGTVDWTDTANRTVSGVSRVIVDPAYNPAAATSDAALFVLSAPTSAPAIRLASDADQGLEQAGTGAVIAGWGATFAGDPNLQYVLQWASTVVQSPGYCGQFSGPSSDLCAVDYPYDDSATCFGDSGGPLIAGDTAGQPVEIGVTSLVPGDCNTVSADYFTAVRPLSGWAAAWIRAVAPAPPPPPPPPAPTAPAASPPPQLPFMTLVSARWYVQQTLSGVLGRTFKRRHGYRTSCSRRWSANLRCNFNFWQGPNDYWGSATVYYVLGSDNTVYWADTYTLHWVNDRCYYHSRHRGSCRIHTKRGSW